MNLNWKHFKLEEFTRSATAEKFNIDNTPNDYVIYNLDKLVVNILDPLREAFGSPIKITSGYRSKKLNRRTQNDDLTRKLNSAVNGVKNSHHLFGKAADIVPIGKSFDEFVKFVEDWIKDKNFNQCIIESSGKSKWIHISYDEGNNRKKIFSITK